MIHYTECPVCHIGPIQSVFFAEDHTVSHETFEIWSCRNCSARFTQNVPDSTQIDRYYESKEYISHSNVEGGLINSLYHVVRKMTVYSKRRLIEKATRQRGGRILDIGSGTGSFLDVMRKGKWQVTGLEPNAGAVLKAKELYDLDLLSPEELFLLEPGSFDVITLWHVLEHVHDLDAYLTKLRELLTPGGRLFIAVPNYTSYDASHYKQNWAAYDVPRHLYHFSPLAMKLLLQKHAFRLVERRPMWFDSFYVSMLSEKYKKGFLAPLPGVVIGLISNINALFSPKKASSLIYIAA